MNDKKPKADANDPTLDQAGWQALRDGLMRDIAAAAAARGVVVRASADKGFTDELRVEYAIEGGADEIARADAKRAIRALCASAARSSWRTCIRCGEPATVAIAGDRVLPLCARHVPRLSFFRRLAHRFWVWLENTTPAAPPTPPLDEWFEVDFDAEEIRVNVQPPGKPWQSAFQWRQIERICYRVEAPGVSDGIHLSLAPGAAGGEPERVAVPVEAKGGDRFWQEILRRGLFDAGLAIHVATSVDGVYCWPEDESR